MHWKTTAVHLKSLSSAFGSPARLISVVRESTTEDGQRVRLTSSLSYGLGFKLMLVAVFPGCSPWEWLLMPPTHGPSAFGHRDARTHPNEPPCTTSGGPCMALLATVVNSADASSTFSNSQGWTAQGSTWRRLLMSRLTFRLTVGTYSNSRLAAASEPLCPAFNRLACWHGGLPALSPTRMRISWTEVQAQARRCRMW